MSFTDDTLHTSTVFSMTNSGRWTTAAPLSMYFLSPLYRMPTSAAMAPPVVFTSTGNRNCSSRSYNCSSRSYNCSSRSYNCSSRSYNCSSRSYNCSSRSYNCSSRIYNCSPRSYNCSSRSYNILENIESILAFLPVASLKSEKVFVTFWMKALHNGNFQSTIFLQA